MKKIKRLFKRLFLAGLLILLIGFLIPQKLIIPVEGATPKVWNVKTFWYYLWGSLLPKKGVI